MPRSALKLAGALRVWNSLNPTGKGLVVLLKAFIYNTHQAIYCLGVLQASKPDPLYFPL
jgi:hypothetical protein